MSELITEIKSDLDLKTAKEQISFLTSLINNNRGGGKSYSSKLIISSLSSYIFQDLFKNEKLNEKIKINTATLNTILHFSLGIKKDAWPIDTIGANIT